MSERMLDLLIRQWPGETHLTAEETAKVLKQHPYTVRERMRNGELPGAEKRDGIWKMPLPDLAEHIEPTPKAPQIPPPPVIVGAARRRNGLHAHCLHGADDALSTRLVPLNILVGDHNIPAPVLIGLGQYNIHIAAGRSSEHAEPQIHVVKLRQIQRKSAYEDSIARAKCSPYFVRITSIVAMLAGFSQLLQIIGIDQRLIEVENT